MVMHERSALVPAAIASADTQLESVSTGNGCWHSQLSRHTGAKVEHEREQQAEVVRPNGSSTGTSVGLE